MSELSKALADKHRLSVPQLVAYVRRMPCDCGEPTTPCLPCRARAYAEEYDRG